MTVICCAMPAVVIKSVGSTCQYKHEPPASLLTHTNISHSYSNLISKHHLCLHPFSARLPNQSLSIYLSRRKTATGIFSFILTSQEPRDGLQFLRLANSSRIESMAVTGKQARSHTKGKKGTRRCDILPADRMEDLIYETPFYGWDLFGSVGRGLEALQMEGT